MRSFAIVAPNYYPRVCGVGDHTARLGDELRRRGHEVVVFSREPAVRHPEAPQLDVEGVPGRLPMVIAERMAAAVAVRRPTDVIVQYTSQMWDVWRFGSPALAWLVRQARRSGARVTLVVHELFAPWGRRPDLMAAAVLQRLQLAAVVGSSDRVLVTTETRVARATPYCRLAHLDRPGVMRVGANALPVPRRRARGEAAAAPRFGVFSTAGPNKRLDVILDAFAAIAREIPAAELVLLGDLGPAAQPHVRQIVSAAARHPAAQRIRMTGNLPLERIAAEIADLDVYLFPMVTGANTRSGTLPVALGSGLPVIAVKGEETDEMLFRDGENVVFAGNLDGAAFAAAALRLLRDPPLMERVGDGARRLYLEHLSWPRIVDGLERVA
jgi:glycosyltransferase involved in cell wall biosynthesis